MSADEPGKSVRIIHHFLEQIQHLKIEKMLHDQAEALLDGGSR